MASIINGEIPPEIKKYHNNHFRTNSRGSQDSQNQGMSENGKLSNRTYLPESRNSREPDKSIGRVKSSTTTVAKPTPPNALNVLNDYTPSQMDQNSIKRPILTSMRMQNMPKPSNSRLGMMNNLNNSIDNYRGVQYDNLVSKNLSLSNRKNR